MGGTFDPIHKGHLVAAAEARRQFDLSEVVFIPAGMPWQKRNVSPAEDRYLLTVLATAPNPSFSVSRVEIDRGGPSYTLQTLRELNAFYRDSAELFFITGADAVAEILSWKDPEAVLAEACFIAATRPGYDLADVKAGLFGDRVKVMEIPLLSISSTDIRKRIAAGRPIRDLVPPEVELFIRQRGLYRARNSAGL